MLYADRIPLTSSIILPLNFVATAYLKEPPYATPLIPSAAPTIELATILGQFLHAPNLLILIGIVGFLLTCLLMALMLLSVGSRRSQRGKSKNLVSREVQTSHTVSPVQSARFERGVRSIDEYAANTTATIAAPPITGPRVHTANQVAAQMTSLHGFDNFGFERDHSFILIPPPPSKSSKHPTHNKKVGTPNIYFPNPPSAASTSAAQSSADSLSDASSIYYIKKPPKRERDRDRDRLTDSSRTRGRVYATILRKPSNRKPIANHVKQKRKYLKSENRVGTLVETAQVHSSHSDITHIDGNSDTFDEDKDANVYEHIEAINPFAGNYANQRKRQFDEKTKSAERVNVTGQRDDDAPNVQYNNHFLGKSQRENDRRSRTTDAELKSSAAVKNAGVLDKKSTKQRQSPHETGDNDDAISVGSFLSMASVRSFPKCVVPEPLTRVLNCDDDIETAEAINRVPRIVDTKLKNDGWTAPRPPKSVDDGKFVHLTRTRSDGADPGVIGPIVWQIHKQQQEANGWVIHGWQPTTNDIQFSIYFQIVWARCGIQHLSVIVTKVFWRVQWICIRLKRLKRTALKLPQQTLRLPQCGQRPNELPFMRPKWSAKSESHRCQPSNLPSAKKFIWI